MKIFLKKPFIYGIIQGNFEKNDYESEMVGSGGSGNVAGGRTGRGEWE